VSINRSNLEAKTDASWKARWTWWPSGWISS